MPPEGEYLTEYRENQGISTPIGVGGDLGQNDPHQDYSLTRQTASHSLVTDPKSVSDAPHGSDLGSGVTRKASIYTYFIQGDRGGPIKIGIAKDVAKRVKSIQTSHPFDLVVLATIPANRESELHQRFAAHRTRTKAKGEWFHPSPELVAFIKSLAEGIVPNVRRSPSRTIGSPHCASLLVGHLLREIPGKFWPVAEAFDSDEMAESVEATLYDIHQAVFNRPAASAEPEESDGWDDDEGDGAGLHEDDCDCEACAIEQGGVWLGPVNPHGFIVLDNGAIYVIAQWPRKEHLRRAFADRMHQAFWNLDIPEFTLHAVLFNEDGDYDIVERLSNDDWYGLPRGEWSFQHAGPVNAFLGFKGRPSPLPAAAETGGGR